ncbi:MAG: polymer-forming cytoskeletal protein [Thermoplasmata archaeon]|nr:MAG: polymer-forming cytoskeletal protein [Thermoplasmata archaeon]
MPFDKKTLVIPNETTIEDNTIHTNGDAVIDYHADVNFNFKTEKRIFVGDRVKIQGDLEADDDIRVDTFTEIDGNITSNNDIYLGEKVHIKGKLTVGRDLDVGNDVKIDEGYDAKGWINVQSSFSWLTYLFAYLLYLLRRGESQQVSAILEELESENPMEILISDVFLFVPRHSKMSKETINIRGNCRIGEKCMLSGNYIISGKMKVGAETEIDGSIEAVEDIEISDKVTIKGKLTTKENVFIGDGCQIFGDVFGRKVEMYQTSTVSGTIHAEEGIQLITADTEEMDEKVERFDKGLDELGDILE